MPRFPAATAASLILVLATAARAQIPADLLTVAEKSDYKATARHAEVVALCEALAKSSPLIRLSELGKSVEVRSLPLMIVSDPPVATAAEAKASGKPVVFLFGNIHAGEVDGKEALPILVRELVSQPHNPLLEHLVLAVAPIYNADGNERVAKDNRPGQVGPEEGMGRRENAKGLDLNRDYMKLDAPETRALIRLLNEWDPVLTIDTHTTNGSHHRYTLTYDGAKNPAGDRSLIAFSREKLFAEVGAAVEKSSGYKSYIYGDFDTNHARWYSFPATPRYGTTYIGLRNQLSMLTEAYSYAPFKDRVLVTRDFCLESLRFVDRHRGEIRALLDAANRRAMGPPGDMVAIRSKARALPEKATVLGFVEQVVGRRNVSTGEPKDYRCDIEIDYAPTLEVSRPFAYLIPGGFFKAIDILRAHGIRAEALDAAAELPVEVEQIVKFARARRAYEGHETIDVTESKIRVEPRTIPAGTVVVRTAQPLGYLAVYLLEPRSDDGLTTWNVFDDALAPEKDFPVVRIKESAKLATAPMP